MNFSEELLFFFSALGAFNGIVLSIYIFFAAGRKHIANRFLAIALFMLSIRAAKSVFFYFDDNLVQAFIQIGLIACFLIGPFIYFYVSTVCNQHHKPPKWRLHLLILVPTILTLTFLFPYYEHRHLWSFYLLRLIYLQWVSYLILAGFRLFRLFRKKNTGGSKNNFNSIYNWTLQVLLAFFIVWLAYYTSGYTSYIVGAVTFSVIGYLLILFILNTRKKSVFLLSTTNQKNDPEKSSLLLRELEQLFQSEGIYKQPSLKCADVAKLLSIPSYQLSQAVNESTGENFNQFVNVYRIEAAKEMLRSRPELTIEAVGQECGFKSKSSFYDAFKRHTGTTPSKFV